MQPTFEFDSAILTSLAGGQSVIDLPRLAISTEEQARAFTQAYGFDLENEKDQEKLWYYYRRALVFLEEKLSVTSDQIPAELRDRKNLQDLKKILIWASSREAAEKEHQKWSCVLLRILHAFIHAESDMFYSFAEEIQKQILSPLQASIFTEGTTGTTYLKATSPGERDRHDEVRLVGFEIKPFKTSASTVIKLLAKPDAVAMKIFDRLGVRFITRTMFDSFRVIQFLIDHHLVSFPHIMPDQSSNTLYPAELFSAVNDEIRKQKKTWTDEELEALFRERLESSKDVQWNKKENSFSGGDYQFIKFISRKMIRVPIGEKGEFSFFFPYEVQIMDQASYAKIQSGPSEHQKYKERQKEAARRRIFPE